MRLDLFLKTSRLIRRRATAREMCDRGRVLVNAHQAKAGKEVKQGDTVTLAFTSRVVELQVLLTDAPGKAHHESLYRVTSERRIENVQDPWNKNLS